MVTFLHRVKFFGLNFKFLLLDGFGAVSRQAIPPMIGAIFFFAAPQQFQGASGLGVRAGY
jgi:hypothetical protein